MKNFDENTKHIKWIKKCDEYRENDDVIEEVNSNNDILKHEYSKFNLNKIGRLLAGLITEIEKEEYYYMRGNNFVSQCNWESDHPDCEVIKYSTSIISKNPKRRFLVSEAHNGKFIFPEDVIVLSNSKVYEEEVYFYDENGNFIIDNYPYVKDYIDKLIEDRMNNNYLEVNKEVKVRKKTR